ncbi:MAG: ABC transporter permease [Kiritimatiellia bacterium]
MNIPAESEERVIRPRHGMVAINFRELWQFRELFVFLAWRDIQIRYKQTLIGMLWAVLQPLLTMVILVFVFGRLAKMDSGGMPYAVLTFAAVLPWQFFATAITSSSASVVGSGGMISKVYFPRLIIPGSSALSGIMDFVVSLGILFLLMIFYQVPFRIHLLLIPVFVLAAVLTAFAFGLWLSALNVKYRDVKYIVPFLVRMGMYVSPVGFMSSLVPGKWRFLYSLNPMVGVIDGFRWAILGPKFEPSWPGFAASLAVVFVILVSGLYYFRATEKTFADVI